MTSESSEHHHINLLLYGHLNENYLELHGEGSSSRKATEDKTGAHGLMNMNSSAKVCLRFGCSLVTNKCFTCGV